MNKIEKGMNLDEAKETVGEAYREWIMENCLENDGLWAALTIMPDGEIVSRLAASPEYGEAEYYGREPHPRTIATMRRNFNGDADEICHEGNWCDEVEFIGWDKFVEEQNLGNRNFESEMEEFIAAMI